jgi:hypothetical protein
MAISSIVQLQALDQLRVPIADDSTEMRAHAHLLERASCHITEAANGTAIPAPRSRAPSLSAPCPRTLRPVAMPTPPRFAGLLTCCGASRGAE